MKNIPLISFAIPTYNFGKYIKHAIESILEGTKILSIDEYEVVILDGGSNDDTSMIVSELSERYRNIKYIYQKYKGGIDHDMNKVVESANGKYIWIFSSDDFLNSGWDILITPLINRDPDVLLVPAYLCSADLSPLRANPIFNVGHRMKNYYYEFNSGNFNTTEYLSKALSLEALFGYMSSIIIRADIWHSLKERDDYFGSCWAHCAKLIPVLSYKYKILYLNRYILNKRMENDSFSNEGWINRISISVMGWDRIIQELFFTHEHRDRLYQLLRHDMSILIFIYAKISAKNKKDLRELNSLSYLLFKYRYPNLKSNIKYLIYKCTPCNKYIDRIVEPFMGQLKKIRHKLKRANMLP